MYLFFINGDFIAISAKNSSALWILLQSSSPPMTIREIAALQKEWIRKTIVDSHSKQENVTFVFFSNSPVTLNMVDRGYHHVEFWRSQFKQCLKRHTNINVFVHAQKVLISEFKIIYLEVT